MTFKDIAKDWVEAGCKLVDDNKDNPKMYAYGVKKALNTMLENFAEVPVIEWHPYPEEKPMKPGTYLITSEWGDEPEVAILPFVAPFFSFADTSITAWAELPAPYKEKET